MNDTTARLREVLEAMFAIAPIGMMSIHYETQSKLDESEAMRAKYQRVVAALNALAHDDLPGYDWGGLRRALLGTQRQ